MKKSRVGEKVGRWTIMSESKRIGKKYYVECVCDCGTKRDVKTDSLSGEKPRSMSCGCLNRETVTGVKRQVPIGTVFGRFVVTGETFREGEDTFVPVKCSCGTEKNVRRYALEKGITVSCGCYNTEMSSQRTNNLRHGMSGTPTHTSWASMRQRCYNENDINYNNYGGRGITVCDRWNPDKGGSFENFYEDMGIRPDDMSLERKDVNGDYEPSNCIWATQTEQCFNRRKFKNTSSKYIGVNWDSWKNKWTATLKKNRVTVFKKDFLTEEAAARAYDEACFQHYGVRKNFPEES